MRNPADALETQPLIQRVLAFDTLPNGKLLFSWIMRGGLLGAAYDESTNTSSIWRWQSPTSKPERVVRLIQGRVMEVTPDERGARAVVAIARASNDLGSLTARTDVHLVDFRARTAVDLLRSSDTNWLRFRPFAHFSPDGARVAFFCCHGGPKPPIRSLLWISDGTRAKAIDCSGVIVDWTAEGLLVDGAGPRPDVSRHLLVDDRTGTIKARDANWTLSPDGRFRVRCGETTLSIIGSDGVRRHVPAKRQAGSISYSRPWLHPHWLLWPMDPWWLALNVETREFRRLLPHGRDGHSIPSPDGSMLVVDRDGHWSWAPMQQ